MIKIKELATEAGFMDAWFSESGDDCETEIKAFAKLIIQECIDMCDEVDQINKYHIEKDFIDPEFGPKECIDVINTHFGVEYEQED